MSQIVISTGDLGARIDKWVRREGQQEELEAFRQGDGSYYSRPALSGEYVAPATGRSGSCAECGSSFSARRIGVQDDFFELGGDSLKAITVVSAIHKELSVEIGLPVFFNMPTIQQLSAYIDGAERSVYHDIEPPRRRTITSCPRRRSVSI